MDTECQDLWSHTCYQGQEKKVSAVLKLSNTVASFYFLKLGTILIPPPLLLFLCWLVCCFFIVSKARLSTLHCLGKALEKNSPAWETVNRRREGADKFASFGGLFWRFVTAG